MKPTDTSTEDRMTQDFSLDQEGRPFVPFSPLPPTLIARALDEQVNLEIPLLKPVAD